MAVRGNIDYSDGSRRCRGCGEEQGWEKKAYEEEVGDIICLKLDFEGVVCDRVWDAHYLEFVSNVQYMSKNSGNATPALLIRMWSLLSLL